MKRSSAFTLLIFLVACAARDPTRVHWPGPEPIRPGSIDILVTPSPLHQYDKRKIVNRGTLKFAKLGEWTETLTLPSDPKEHVFYVRGRHAGWFTEIEVKNYKGEAEIERLHSDGKLFQLFRELSYLGKAKGAQLRTNMGYRKGAFFYDQFLTTPDLASKLADGGAFLEDCGVIAFGTRSKYMKGLRKKLKEGNEKGLKEFRKHFPKDETLTTAQKNQLDTANEKADKKTTSLSDNNATWRISDHRVIWMQLKLFP